MKRELKVSDLLPHLRKSLIARLIPMKRELKVLSDGYGKRTIGIARLIPMKRELKEYVRSS